MNKPKVDLLETHQARQIKKNPAQKRRKFFIFGRVTINLLIIVLIVGMAYSTKAVIATNNLSEQFGDTSIFSQFKHLILDNDKPAKGEESDRINILLLGVGGKKHQGAELTDTIMVASIRPSDKKISLLSIPRDMVAPISGIGWQRINSANVYGANLNPDTKGAGPALASETVEKVTGLDIHYYIKMNFEGFTKLVDTLGGLRVYVAREFTDSKYPDESFGYEPVHFDQGWQDLDGERALKYARSRHGNNNEGSDFARAKRQQQILRAIQIKASSLSTLLNPNKLIKLSEVVGENIETDMELWESFRLFEMVKETNTNEINQVVLSNGPQGLLSSYVSEDGAYLLRPRLGSGNFGEIQSVAQNLLQEDPFANLNQVTPVINENSLPRLIIQNGTTFPGLAGYYANILKKDYNITEVANAPSQDYEEAVVYKISDNTDNTDIQDLTQFMNAKLAQSTPDNFKKPGADILLILGLNSIPEEDE